MVQSGYLLLCLSSLTNRDGADREPQFYPAFHEFNPSIRSDARSRSRQLIFFSLGVWQAQSRAAVYAEASAIVYMLGQSRGVTAIAKIAGGLVLLRM